ncbi:MULTISPECIES: VOC family protein [Brevibacterium]|uniref:VOC family protein n=1 Tax=Brevibacterium casei TaxID=33889 RepID=A0A7T3ZYV1_9MICO|nr:VOC family protein [Brevibacterium casei]QQB14142.1 VOC family protein [Brevibacterium casei]
MSDFPRLLHTVLDAEDPRSLAEFYRQFLGLRYRSGDDPPVDGGPDDADWLVLVDAEGRRTLAIQQTDELTPTTWPDPAVPMQLHLDFTVPDTAALETHRARALDLGARQLLDRADDPDELLYVLADPAGHPFCVFVA